MNAKPPKTNLENIIETMEIIEHSLCLLPYIVHSLNYLICFNNQETVAKITNTINIYPENTIHTITLPIKSLISSDAITVCFPLIQHINTQIKANIFLLKSRELDIVVGIVTVFFMIIIIGSLPWCLKIHRYVLTGREMDDKFDFYYDEVM